MTGETRCHDFTFTWRIEEFSLSRQRFEECHRSPAFYVGPIKFDVSLYPRGKNDGEYISLYINRIQQEDTDEPGEILIDITFALKNFEDDSVLLRRECKELKINKNQCLGYEKFAERELIVDAARRRYLPRDTLTIYLTMIVTYTVNSDQKSLKEGLENLSNDFKYAFEKKIMTDFTFETINGNFQVHKAVILARVPKLAEEVAFNENNSARINIEPSVFRTLLTYLYCGKLDMSTVDLPHKLYQTAKRLQLKRLEQKLLPVAVESSARTVLKGERITLTWTITDFPTRNRYERVSSPLLQNGSAATTMLKLIFSIERDEEGKDVIVFYIRRLSCTEEPRESLFLACRICVLEKNGDRNCSKFFEHLYTSDEEWKIQYILKKSLTTSSSLSSNVTFMFDMLINEKDDWSEINGVSFLSETENVNETGQLASDLENLFRNSIHNDVTFTSQGVEFPVHKFVLASRSLQFREMFEKKDFNCEMTGVSADTVGRMFLYMYTGKTDMYSYEITEDLYKAAAKYKIRDLKVKCATMLKTFISKEKVYPLRILEVAGNGEDDDLKMFTLNYLVENCPDILGTQLWKDFLRRNPELGGDALQYIATNLHQKRN